MVVVSCICKSLHESLVVMVLLILRVHRHATITTLLAMHELLYVLVLVFIFLFNLKVDQFRIVHPYWSMLSLLSHDLVYQVDSLLRQLDQAEGLILVELIYVL